MRKNPFVIVNGIIIVIAILYIVGYIAGLNDEPEKVTAQAGQPAQTQQTKPSTDATAASGADRTAAASAHPASEDAGTSSPQAIDENAETSADTSAVSKPDQTAMTSAQDKTSQPVKDDANAGERSTAIEKAAPHNTVAAENNAQPEPVPTASTPTAPATPAPTPDQQATTARVDRCIASAPRGARIMVATATVNVRAGPGTNQHAIGQVKSGDQVIVVDSSDNGWIYLRHCSLEGWAYKPLFKTP